jgi:hypothetical protein
MAYAMNVETAIVVPGEYTFSNFRRAMGVTALRPGAAAMECKVLVISKLYVGALCAIGEERAGLLAVTNGCGADEGLGRNSSRVRGASLEELDEVS